MNLRWSVGVQWALMVLVSAFLFVSFFHLNDWLFESLEYVKGVNWVFLPAGFRVLLVLALGIPGALGIALGTFWLDTHAAAPPPPAEVMLLTCLASGFGPWLVKFWMQWRGLLDRELRHLSSASLLQFVLIYAAINAVAHQLLFWVFSMHNSQPWLDIWPMFFGDLAGALIVLYSFKLGLDWIKSRTDSTN